MEPEKGALDEFAEDFPANDPAADPFQEGTQPPEKETEPEPTEEQLAAFKNRHIRRLEKKIEEERLANIELNAQLKATSELQRFTKDVGVDADLHSVLFGNTEETAQTKATVLALEKVLQKHTESAKNEALREFESRQEAVVKAQREAERFIDDELEGLEDVHNVDLTSDAPSARKARRELLELVQKASPKDANGDIKEYADFEAVFDLYQSSKKNAPASRSKDLASRSMVRSGNTQGSVANKAGEDYLKSIGIL